MNPKISIILPTWKEAKYINRAIESILSQTFSDWELIIIDDGLYEEKYNEVKDFIKKDKRIILLKNEKNLGIQKSSNKGLREAKGEYIARIDDDEWISKDKLQKQVEFLDKNQDYVLVGTSTVIVGETGKELVRYLLPETDKDIRRNFLWKNNFINSSMVFRKNIVINFGGYDERDDVKHVEDYELFLHLGLFGRLYNIPMYLTSYTVRIESISANNRIKQFKRDIKLTQKYKDGYPRYFLALIMGYLRLFLYKIFEETLFNLDSLKYKILKIYKGF